MQRKFVMRRNRFVPILAIAALAGALVTGECMSAAATASARAAPAAGGNVDPAHNSELELRLTHGSLRLSIAALDEAFVKAGSHAPIYPRTCTDLISVAGTTPIVAGSGTGAYRGIRGAFPVTLTLNEVEARPCQPSPGAFRAQLITMSGSGTVSWLR
jgi:hypothetical protein